MSDSLQPFHIDRSQDNGASWVEKWVVGPTVRQQNDPDLVSGSPSGSYQYRIREVTTNLVNVPYNSGGLTSVSPGKLLWAYRSSIGGNDRFNSIALDSGGNFILGGQDGSRFALLRKLSSSRQVIWDLILTATGGGSSTILGVALDSSDNIFVTGYYASVLDCGNGKTVTSIGGSADSDIFVAKFNSAGVCQWVNSYGTGQTTLSAERGTGIVADHAGNLLVVGQITGSSDFGGGLRIASGGTDVFILKLDTSGNHLWSIITGSASDDTSGGIAVDASNNVFFTGGVYGTMTIESTSITSTSARDVFLWKLDSEGHPIWANHWGGFYQDVGLAVAVSSQGNPVITGYFNITVNFGGGDRTAPGGFDGADGFVAQYSGVDGSWMWDRQFNNASSRQNTPNTGGFGIVCDSAGNVIVGGAFRNSIKPGTETFTGFNAFAVKYSPIGQHIWSHGFGANNFDSATCVVTDGTGAYVAGAFIGAFQVDGNQVMATTGDGDGFLLKFAP